eukprot:m.149142 g.149142  ORF g.149142 m.149142 type:complete len:153 (+) comp13270_c2_seq8:236-694(+)
MTEVHEVKYDDGDKYIGQWNGEGKRHGLGVLHFADGSCYSGEFTNGMNHGFGVIKFADGSMYEGEFVDGKYNGHGVFTGKDKMKYEGEFQDGKVSGGGKVTFADGSPGRPRQEGTFQDRKLLTCGKQGAAVRQAQEAQQNAQKVAKDAAALK